LKNKETRTLENSNKHIDNWLSQQFEDFTPNPEPALWQSIDATLDRKERQQKFIWYWLVAGVLSIVAAGAAFQWNKISHKPQAAKPLEAQLAVSNHKKMPSVDPSATTDPSISTENSSNGTASTKSNSTVSSGSQKLHKSENQSGGVKNNQEPKLTTSQQLNQSIVEISDAVQSDKTSESEFLSNILDVNPFGLTMVELATDANDQIMSSKSMSSFAWSIPAKKEKILGRWAVEAGLDANQTGLSYRTSSDMSKYVHKNYFNHMKDGEFALSAGRFNVSTIYQLTQHHALKLGVAYAENRTLQRFDFRDSMPATVVPGNKPDALGYYPIFGYLGLGPEVKFNSQTTYSMISVPLGYVGYFPLAKQYSITPEVLLQANKLSVSTGAQTLDYQTLLQTAQDPTHLRKLIWGARVAVGVEKRLNYSQAIGLRFNAQSMLTPMYIPNAALQPRGWSLGLSAHYSWRIQ